MSKLAHSNDETMEHIERAALAREGILTEVENAIRDGMRPHAAYHPLEIVRSLRTKYPQHLSDKPEVIDGCECAICKLHRK